MKLSGLSRQIALSMMTIALGVALLIILSSYLFYFAWKTYWPQHFPTQETWVPTSPEWAWMIGTTLVGLAMAVMVSIHLSRRILIPLNSLAESIRHVSQGDLSVRALAGDPVLGEVSSLTDDFNALVSKLQRMTEEQQFWSAAIAHELRTPVTVLRGRLQGLAEGVFTPDESQFRSLLRQVEGLARLIEDLRAVSLAESGHLDLHVKQTDLAAEICAVAEMSGAEFASAGQQVLLDLDVQHVRCDPIRVRQALLALLDNVRQHASPGPVKISSRVEGNWCLLSVEDSGPGIPSEFMPHVFTAFRRAEGARRDGSGLGLAVVAAIARAHDGRIECKAAPAGGTLFELTWPCR
ncbi:HAMP domain-containing protein [Xanthomonas euvesicatoria pv. alangii]|uniref:sensor histidine kinase n=1 Tax=Xanthomonas euvesicatoria TaxID=456327 RepID=UPI001C4836BC|nr:HAMP domain-containing sensor histidine kinase [Xanthomonas euvesicatoria]MBV6670068.1 HAMP domain-containing protein [Xanthomonas euvesicatoria pv. alangii]